MSRFTLAVLSASGTAKRLHLDNVPLLDVAANLARLADSLDVIESIYGAPLILHSAYRSPAVNVAVGGSTDEACWLAALEQLGCSEADALKLYGIKKPKEWKAPSYHLIGCADDHDPPNGLTHDAAQHLLARHRDVLPFDLILEEGTVKPESEGGSRWLHYQIAKPGVSPRYRIRDAIVDKLGGTITRTSPG